MASKAEQYEARFPGVDIPEAQREERMDRLAFKEERRSARRTARTRGVVIPRVPWHDEKETA